MTVPFNRKISPYPVQVPAACAVAPSEAPETTLHRPVHPGGIRNCHFVEVKRTPPPDALRTKLRSQSKLLIVLILSELYGCPVGLLSGTVPAYDPCGELRQNGD
jgi:hypothetical protein